MQHRPGPGSELGPPEGSPTGEESSPPAKIRKVEETKRDAGADITTPASSTALPLSSPADDTKESPQLKSSLCTCHCGGCCCHGTSEPQHCARCHTEYTLNHPEACMVPHVFSSYHLRTTRDSIEGSVSVHSVCCGSDMSGGEPLKSEWDQPSPCFIGWHTTNVNTVDEQYNGFNVLRCIPGPGGKCQRAQMKHHAHYQNLFDDGVKYEQIDEEDRKRYLQRKRAEMENEEYFKDVFWLPEHALEGEECASEEEE